MNQKQLAYLTSVTMGMFSQGLESPMIHNHKKPETKYDKKKCKSCKYFCKGCKGVISTCNHPFFKVIRKVQPLDVACIYYKKRKR